MVGRAINAVTFLEPTLWSFALGERERLQVECLWRIVQDGSIALTSEDHAQQFGLPAPIDAAHDSASLLAGRHVISVKIRESTADLLIELSGNTRLEIVPTSSGYEAWQLKAPGGRNYVATGGGGISTWTE